MLGWRSGVSESEKKILISAQNLSFPQVNSVFSG